MYWLPNLFLLLVLHLKQSECSSQFAYKYYEELEGYLTYHIVPATWHDARLRCLYEGGELPSPTNSVIQKVMREIWNQSQGTHTALWTGVHSTFSKGDYYSLRGVPLARMPITWAPDEPDNCQNAENCLAMLPSGTISDVMCNETFPYTCFRKKNDMLLKPCGTADPDYTLDWRTLSCYKFHREGLTWSRAFMTCAAEGGHLAVIDTVGEELVLKEIFARHPANTLCNTHYKDSALVGFSKWSEEGTWTTIHGEKLKDLIAASKGRWSDGQPDNSGGNQNCGAIFRPGFYDDIWCDRPTAFICEKSLGLT